jgi:hypothetical protein
MPEGADFLSFLSSFRASQDERHVPSPETGSGKRTQYDAGLCSMRTTGTSGLRLDARPNFGPASELRSRRASAGD